MTTEDRSLYDRIAAALLWAAAFSWASGIYLGLTLSLRALPPTAPVAVGLIPILHLSKLQDYAALALFLTVVPILTVALRYGGTRLIDRERALVAEPDRMTLSLVLTAPFFLAPFLYLTSGKIGWVLLLPPAMAWVAGRCVRLWSGKGWFAPIFRPELGPFHALLAGGAVSILLFRYLVTGRRIAHSPTLFLELVFVAGFAAALWAAAIGTAELLAKRREGDAGELFARIASGAAILPALPLLAICIVPLAHAAVIAAGAVIVAAVVPLFVRRPMSARSAWKLAAFLVLPVVVGAISYASTAHQSEWLDLFHRGESLGPASDYLRGKVPYRGVFALHGMLEDGLLDAWLMQLFGRSVTVTLTRSAVMGALLPVSLWFAGLAFFESIPLASMVVLLGSWTTAENDRTFFQVVVVTLLWLAMRRSSRLAGFCAGVVGGIALFHSYDIGLYSIAGAIVSTLLLAFVAARVGLESLRPWRAALWFAGGVVAGMAPFMVYLAMRGALGDFISVSFVVIPHVIDAVWSLPFPDLIPLFRGSTLNLHTLADFVLYEKLHLVLSPIVIAIAAVYLIHRCVVRRARPADAVLLLVTVFLAVTQRSAFGRAEFRHQYFSAALLGPLLVILVTIVWRPLRNLWPRGGEGERAFVVTVALILVLVASVALWIPDLVNARLDDFIGYGQRVQRAHYDMRADQLNDRVRAVSAYVREVVPAGGAVYDFSNQPALYFFADRPNPTRFYQVPISSPRDFQAEVIAALERSHTQVVLRTSPERYDEFDGVPNSLRAQAVSAYIDDCYTFDRSVRGVEVWRRRPGVHSRPVGAYLSRIRMPAATEIVSLPLDRMVFPSVGSAGGAGGAFWVSSLTLQNPRRTPLTLSLRYSAGEVHVDRSLTLAPREARRWGDVARALFQTGDRVGNLWISYRGAPPFAMIETSDVAHGGRAAIERPLASVDAAVAGMDLKELAVAGLPAEGSLQGRVISLGLINVGNAPAEYRVTARAPNGAVIGRPFDLAVPEDQVELVPNVEQRLGVAVGQTITIRVSVLRGAAVGFARVSDPSGGNEFVPAVPGQGP